MNEMYSMGIDIHDIGVIGMVMVIAINMIMTQRADDRILYLRKMRIYTTPATVTMLGTIIFTGMIMMAAKHLDFTIENIAMIIAAVVMIVLEVKRLGLFKRIDTSTPEGFARYKKRAIYFLKIELALLLLISVWMLIR